MGIAPERLLRAVPILGVSILVRPHVVLRWKRSGNNDQRFSAGYASGKILFRTLREDVHDRTVVGISPTGAAVTWPLGSNWRQSADPGQLFQVEWQPDGQTFALREGTRGEFLSVTSGGGAVRWSGVDGKNEKPKSDQLFQFFNPRREGAGPSGRTLTCTGASVAATSPATTTPVPPPVPTTATPSPPVQPPRTPPATAATAPSPAAPAAGKCDPENQCRSLVQGQVPWSRSPDPAFRQWQPANLDALCGCTANAPATVLCFQNALASSGNSWSAAIDSCKASGATTTAMTAPSTPAPAGSRRAATGVRGRLPAVQGRREKAGLRVVGKQLGLRPRQRGSFAIGACATQAWTCWRALRWSDA